MNIITSAQSYPVCLIKLSVWTRNTNLDPSGGTWLLFLAMSILLHFKYCVLVHTSCLISSYQWRDLPVVNALLSEENLLPVLLTIKRPHKPEANELSQSRDHLEVSWLAVNPFPLAMKSIINCGLTRSALTYKKDIYFVRQDSAKSFSRLCIVWMTDAGGILFMFGPAE